MAALIMELRRQLSGIPSHARTLTYLYDNTRRPHRVSEATSRLP